MTSGGIIEINNHQTMDSLPHSHKNDKLTSELDQQLAKKKTSDNSDGIMLRSVTIPRRTGENDKLYFLLSTLVLLLTCAIIIGACWGIIYFALN